MNVGLISLQYEAKQNKNETKERDNLQKCER